MENINWVEVSSVFIAVCALFLTLWQARQIIKHNKLSVRPYLSWSHTRDLTGQGKIYQIEMKNLGLGPAIIKKLRVTYDGDKITEDFKIFVNNKIEPQPYGGHVDTTTIVPPFVLIKDKPDIIFKFEGQNPNNKVEDLFMKLGLYVEYTSFYEDKVYTLDTKNL